MFRNLRVNAFIVSVIAVVTATVIICISAAACSGAKLTFECSYYFVCYRIADNSISASSLSETVSSYGGAGYILNYEDGYYVTVSCYYTQRDADTVCSGLKKRELDCNVLKISTKNYKLNGYSAKNNAELYLGNLNTLHSLSLLAYECANGLDTGEYTQSKAKDVLSNLKSGLNGLKKSNPSNCFTDCLEMLIAQCEDRESGYLYSKDMRYMQIAVTDAIINARLN